MAKHKIDDILSELGIADSKKAESEIDARRERLRQAQAARAAKSGAGKAPTGEDDDAPTYSPLPSRPANTQKFGDEPAPTEPGRPGPAAEARPDAPRTPDAAKPVTVGRALADIYRPELDTPDARSQELGDLLVARGVISDEKLTLAENVLKQSPGRRLYEIAIEQGADEAGVMAVVAELAALPFERIDLSKGLEGGFDGGMIQRLTADYCKKRQVIPLRMEGQRAVVACVRPDDVFQVDDIRQKLGVVSVKVVLTTAFDIRGALEILGEGQQENVDISQILSEVGEDDVQVEKKQGGEVDLEKEAAESPVIRYVNYIIQQASREGASDIHIEPGEKKLKVRFRIDGELYESMNPPPAMASAIVSRLKIMANLDISERRLPQDGRIRCMVQGRKLDLRLSTLPCGYGEKVVMRILDTKSINVSLDNLGFDEDTLEIWKKQVDLPHGIVLVTGPTGSGKTTTLYASLRQIDKNSMNVSTVEDPIEYHLDGITQTQTHEKIGMTFAAALKSLLRQDPDVIMLGEIRDHETAHIAVQAALTGHLVLSTLHTNDAPSTVVRLMNMGIEAFLVTSAVNTIVAQRL
ncbi:MAG: ATPase, T2SS/T4P/T4SS family, partial [Planctomycetota bacterium]|nr:ATPase, T2SS/T4P/T4SS family [Planctomycetota bacterium]